MLDAPALTSLSHGAGCGCKIAAADLLPVVASLPPATAPELLVGSATADDAAVWRLRDDLALVQTTDFFTPVVDDPYDFGRIAAANALSDVYAMGGTPITALNLVAWPLQTLGADALAAVLRGGLDVVRAAGAEIVGGHSIDDPEPKYGLAVTGTVHPDRILANAGGRPGDALVLTKPLGVGAIVTARKRGAADDALLAAAVDVMTRLNDAAAAAALRRGGERRDRRDGLRPARPPAPPGARERRGGRGRRGRGAGDRRRAEALDAVSGGSRRNAEWAAGFAHVGDAVPAARIRLLTDATTSGGLLIAVDPARAHELPGPVIGRLVAGEPGAISVA